MVSALDNLRPPKKGGPRALRGASRALRGPRGPHQNVACNEPFKMSPGRRGPSRPCPLEATIPKLDPFYETGGSLTFVH